MSIAATWKSYTQWLAEHAPDAFENLAPPATDAQLAGLEKAIGQVLPDDIKTFLQLNNGENDWAKCPALPGLVFLSTEKIAHQWHSWETFRQGETAEGLAALDNHAAALDPGVRDVYTHPGWLPLLKDGARADFLGLDLAPSEGGVVGQIINFGRDEDKHFVAFPSLLGLLEFWLAEVQMGSCSVSPPDLPDYPYAWFAHEKNSIDVLRRFCAKRRAEA
jgi:cell wall assembly regulator SMI1